MSARGDAELARMRRCRRLFETAMRARVSMAGAAAIVKREDAALRAQRIARIRACGRAPIARPGGETAPATPPVSGFQDDNEGLKWFQR